MKLKFLKVATTAVALVASLFAGAQPSSATDEATFTPFDTSASTGNGQLFTAGNFAWYSTGFDNSADNNVVRWNGTTHTPILDRSIYTTNPSVNRVVRGTDGKDYLLISTGNNTDGGFIVTDDGTNVVAHNATDRNSATYMPYWAWSVPEAPNYIVGYTTENQSSGQSLWTFNGTKATEIKYQGNSVGVSRFLGTFGNKTYFTAGIGVNNDPTLYVIDTTTNVISQVVSTLGGTSPNRGFPFVFYMGQFGDSVYFASTSEETSTTSVNTNQSAAIFAITGNTISRVALKNADNTAFNIAFGTAGVRFFTSGATAYLWADPNDEPWVRQIFKLEGNVGTKVGTAGLGDRSTAVEFHGKIYYYDNGGIRYFDGTSTPKTLVNEGVDSEQGMYVYNDRLYYKANMNNDGYTFLNAYDDWNDVTTLISAAQNYNVSLAWDRPVSTPNGLYVIASPLSGGDNKYFKLVWAAPTNPHAIDVDDPALGTVPDETIASDVTSGSFDFSDGSGFTIDNKGRIYAKVKSKFLVQTTGKFTVTYGTKTFTCKVKNFGSKKKLKTTLTVAKLYKTKQACTLPKAAITFMRTGRITVKLAVTVKRYATKTAIAKTATGVRIAVQKRNMIANLGLGPR